LAAGAAALKLVLSVAAGLSEKGPARIPETAFLHWALCHGAGDAESAETASRRNQKLAFPSSGGSANRIRRRARHASVLSGFLACPLHPLPRL